MSAGAECASGHTASDRGGSWLRGGHHHGHDARTEQPEGDGRQHVYTAPSAARLGDLEGWTPQLRPAHADPTAEHNPAGLDRYAAARLTYTALVGGGAACRNQNPPTVTPIV
jgi:hypothetical protein